MVLNGEGRELVVESLASAALEPDRLFVTDMIGRNKVVVVMSKDPTLHTKVHVKQQTCPLDQRLTFALVLRWRL